MGCQYSIHHGSGFCNGLFSCFVILRVFAGEEGRVFWVGMGELFIIFLTKRLLTYFYTHIDFTVNLIISIASRWGK